MGGRALYWKEAVSQTRDALAGLRGHKLSPNVHYFVDPERHLVVVRFGKRVTADDIARYAERLGSHPSFRPEFSEIADLREVEELDLGADDFLKLADQIDPFSMEAKRAFVVRGPVQHHAARMHKVLRTQRSFEIFWSFEDAEQWIRR